MTIDVWVTWWASSDSGHSLGYWLGIYFVLGMMQLFGLAAACL